MRPAQTRTATLGFCILLAAGGCDSTGFSASNTPTGPNPLDSPASAIKIADASRTGGDYPTAIQLYQRAIDKGDNSYAVHLGLAESYGGEHMFDKAIDEYRLAEQISPSVPDPAMGLGRIYLVEHIPSQALSSFDRALTISPGLASAWNGKGVALDLLQQHAEAQDAYRTGLASSPTDRVIRNNLGLSLAFSGDYPEAVKVLTELAQDPAATSRNRQNLALALGLQGNTGDAKFVARTDLDEQSVENNLRYYQAVRQAAAVPSSPASGATE